MRNAFLLVLVGCGSQAFAPVTVAMDTRERGNAIYTSVIANAELKLNPKCTSNCELGATFPDGGRGAWDPIGNVAPDGGVWLGEPELVAVGSVVTFVVGVPNPTTPNADGADVTCVTTREVTAAGVTITAVHQRTAGADSCSFR